MIPGRLWLYLSGLSLLAFMGLALTIPRWFLHQRYGGKIHTPESAPAMPTAVVLGAGLRKDGRPSTVLADRVRTAAQLYAQGKVDQIIMSVSIRGTIYNEPHAMRDLAHELGATGLQVISGLARGIDTAAHEGAIETGTCAVLASGVDIVYPPENETLYERICEIGVLVTEMPPGSEPQARHFPRRNRLISGISAGVVVIEAALRSGSLITARFAAEQGREVFAVPGSPLDPRSRGGNQLIRDGATLIENASHVTEILESIIRDPLSEPSAKSNAPHMPPPPATAAIDAARPVILEKLGPTPVKTDELVRQTGLPAAVVVAILLELEIAGRLERHPGQRMSLHG